MYLNFCKRNNVCHCGYLLMATDCTSLYYNSFLSSAVRDWNNILNDHRNVDSVIAFKNVLSCDKPIVPKHYLFGNRKEQILRTICSFLNYDLYLKKHN